MINWSTVASIFLGGVVTLAATSIVSWWELRRRERQKEKNWYRRIRQLAIRSYMPKATMLFTNSEQRETIARTYDINSEQLQYALADPYADTDPKLYTAIQQLVFYLNQYVNRDPDDRDDNARILDNDDIEKYASIVMYYVENETKYDFDFDEDLQGEDLETAREKYEEWLETENDESKTN